MFAGWMQLCIKCKLLNSILIASTKVDIKMKRQLINKKIPIFE